MLDAISARSRTCLEIADATTFTAVLTPEENGWRRAQLAEWLAVVTCGATIKQARAMLLDSAREIALRLQKLETTLRATRPGPGPPR